MTPNLRDNAELFAKVENIIWRVRTTGGGAREPTREILDAVQAEYMRMWQAALDEARTPEAAPEQPRCNLLVLGCRYTHTCDPSQATHSPGASVPTPATCACQMPHRPGHHAFAGCLVDP
jgi:hypothetical protein